MKGTQAGRNVRHRFSGKALAIVGILVLGLLGGLLHHHDSESDSDACSYCHAGVQTPVIDLAVTLVATTFAVVGFVGPRRPVCLPQVVRRPPFVPRAPPSTTHPAASWEGWVGIA